MLNPIREWRAADVWAYIWWKGLDYNPLYEEDFERIGCYLCPSCLASEWKEHRAASTPTCIACGRSTWTAGRRRPAAGPDFVTFGFWRWKVLPPKMRKLAEEISLKVPRQRSDRLQLKMVKGLVRLSNWRVLDRRRDRVPVGCRSPGWGRS